jgi:hypothetical protein
LFRINRENIFVSMPLKKYVIVLIFLFSLLSCQSVKPWERGILAKPHMALEPEPGLAGMRQHIFFSKEAASGGSSVGGGGCGCN